jgi:hypothetical protein
VFVSSDALGVAVLLFCLSGGVFGYSLGMAQAKRWYQKQLLDEPRVVPPPTIPDEPVYIGRPSLTVIDGGKSRTTRWSRKDGGGDVSR